MMENINQRIADLENSVKQLNAEQGRTTETLNAVLTELQSLKASLQKDAASPQTEVPFVRRSTSFVPPAKKQVPTATNSFRKDQLENLIGSNIINKIGILVTVVGVFIGAKYAIEKELISATTRIILGYSVAAVLCLLAYRLKAKYIDYSAVLMSGSISIIYFITYIAHSFYHLFPQPVAFGLMLFTTAFVVSMSIWYNRKIIALLGQVGAYAIPFLLSTGNENLPLLYGYLSIINIGLLFLSFKRELEADLPSGIWIQLVDFPCLLCQCQKPCCWIFCQPHLFVYQLYHFLHSISCQQDHQKRIVCVNRNRHPAHQCNRLLSLGILPDQQCI